MRVLTLTLTAALSATVALAHSGVQNPAVKARMDLMVEIKNADRTLRDMLKGPVDYDPVVAEAARAALERHASEIAGLFEAQEQDPKSESLPTVWSDWPGFVAEAEKMRVAARAMQTGSKAEALTGYAALGDTCRSCHKAYRIP